MRTAVLVGGERSERFYPNHTDSDLTNPVPSVQVGVTGDGKSTTGNTIVGRAVFSTASGLCSSTSEAEHADFLSVEGGVPVEWRVVDTVGLHDTDMSGAETMRRFAAFSDSTPLGIDVFLFVARWGRWKPEHEAALDAFVANCGEEALSRTLLVWTCCSLSPAQLKAQVHTSAPKSLRLLLPKLAGPPCGVEQVAEGAAGARATLRGAMKNVVGKVDRYTNAALREARKRYDSRKEDERREFAAAIADLRKRSGPVVIEREF